VADYEKACQDIKDYQTSIIEVSRADGEVGDLGRL
jgi:hypothetical protein